MAFEPLLDLEEVYRVAELNWMEKWRIPCTIKRVVRAYGMRQRVRRQLLDGSISRKTIYHPTHHPAGYPYD